MPQSNPRRVRIGNIEIDLDAGSVLDEVRQASHLSRQSQLILEMLLQSRGREVSRAELANALWPDAQSGGRGHSLDTAIHRLRKALGGKAQAQLLIPRTSHGYRLDATVDDLRFPRDTRAIVLAVLPFESGSEDPKQKEMSYGLTEELIRDLENISPARLSVIGPRSMIKYAASEKGIKEIGTELSVDYVVEWKAHSLTSGLVRFVASVSRVTNERVVWSDHYDINPQDVLSVIPQIADAIARSVEVELSQEKQGNNGGQLAYNPVAQDAFLKGRFFWNKRTTEGLRAAINCFHGVIEAIEKQPHYARAYSSLADSYALLGLDGAAGVDRQEMARLAKEAAQKALALSPHLAEGHAALATIKFRFDWQWLDAENHFKMSIKSNPNYSTAHHWYSIFLTAMGRHDEAKAEAKRAQELEPKSRIINTDAVWPYYNAGDFVQALAECDKALNIDRDFWVAHLVRGIILEQGNQFQEAIKEFERAAVDVPNDPRIPARIASARARLGKTREARRILSTLVNPRAPHARVPSYFLATVYCSLGEYSEAIRYLNVAAKERSPSLVFLRVDPSLSELRSEASFRRILQALRFPEIRDEPLQRLA